MRTLTNPDVLDLWDRGSRLHPLDQGLLLLGAIHPEERYAVLADWPLGRRNSAVAKWHCATFGPDLQGWTACPQCGEKLEFRMDGRSLLGPLESSLAGTLTSRGHSFRLPSSRDLARATRESDSTQAAVSVLEACCLDADPVQKWSEEDIEQIGEEMALADAMAETRLTLSCAKCPAQWEESLDIVAFVWSEVEAAAKRLLLEVHTLASAYGWSEPEILALSDARRSCYLAMVRQ
jgi:hypothetical protein